MVPEAHIISPPLRSTWSYTRHGWPGIAFEKDPHACGAITSTRDAITYVTLIELVDCADQQYEYLTQDPADLDPWDFECCPFPGLFNPSILFWLPLLQSVYASPATDVKLELRRYFWAAFNRCYFAFFLHEKFVQTLRAFPEPPIPLEDVDYFVRLAERRRKWPSKPRLVKASVWNRGVEKENFIDETDDLGLGLLFDEAKLVVVLGEGISPKRKSPPT